MGRKRRHGKERWPYGTMEQLEARWAMASDVLRITEFMAANSTTLADEDGEFSDWIEIYNPTRDEVRLLGWSLTDRADRLRMWNLPDTTLGPGEYRVVFASGKDRRDPLGILHTNFRLNADGEYLGLVDPAGDVAQDFGSTFPPQSDDAAFGVPVEQIFWLDANSSSRYRVPMASDDAIGNAWRSLGYDDSGWANGVGGLGYDQRPAYANMGWESNEWEPWGVVGNGSIVDKRFAIPAPQGERQVLLRATEESASRFQIENFLGLARFQLNQVSSVAGARGSALKRSFTVEAGTELTFQWNFLTREPNEFSNSDFAFVSIGDQVIKLGDVSDAAEQSAGGFARETGYRTFRFKFPESGTYTVGAGVLNGVNRFIESALLVDQFRLNGVGSAEELYTPEIVTSVESALAGKSGSLWTRYSFRVLDLEELRGAELRLLFDDAIAVYLNGQQVVAANVPPTVRWDSYANENRSDDDALVSERFRIDVGLFREGDNVLAIQTLKHAQNDENMLLQPTLAGIGPLSDSSQFFVSPSPGRPNTTDSFQVADVVNFSRTHGFYSEPITLDLSSPTPGAVIRYTLDGSEPSVSQGTVYEGPIRIDGTQTVRAVAFAPGYLPSSIGTQSYLFPEDVIAQSRNSVLARGFPTEWGPFWKGVTDYAMDSRIVGQNGSDSFNGLYANTVRDDLLAVPSLSLVMEMDDLFGDAGIYDDPDNRGVDSERPVSVELIHPNGQTGFQINAGIRIQGGISRYIAAKMSFRLLFKDDYGASKLEYPLFGPEGHAEFDSISLRSSSGEHLVGIHYIRDEFARRLQARMGNPVSMGTYMHLYLNGVYWGLYNPTERVDAQFAVNRFGGTTDDFDVYNAGDLGEEGVTAIAGSMEAWRTTLQLAQAVATATTPEAQAAAYYRLLGRNPDGRRNPEYPVYLDVNNYVDYLLLQVYLRNDDWPGRNFYFLRDRRPESEGFKFFAWDSEFTLDSGSRTSISSVPAEGPGLLFNLLRESPDFQLAMADRAAVHFAPGGALYVDPSAPQWDPTHPERNIPASIYRQLADEVAPLLGPEIGRWGDEIGRNGRLFLRHTEFNEKVEQNLRQFFPARSDEFVRSLRAEQFYRDPPTILPASRYVAPGTRVEIVSATNEVYFTLDGTDPRSPDGTVAPSAQRYLGPFEIQGPTLVTARRRVGSNWSAADSSQLFTSALPANVDSLRITEVNYHPHAADRPLGEIDLAEDEFEFIEIQNVSDLDVELMGVELAVVQGQGVAFEFGQQVLAAGERLVIPRHVLAFQSRYGQQIRLARGLAADPLEWHYLGQLSNREDTITLRVDRQVAQRWHYQDSPSWPILADGGGATLEVREDATSTQNAADFRASVEIGGSPGRASDRRASKVVINEILANPGVTGLQRDAIELYNRSNLPIDVSGWYLTDSDRDLRRATLPSGSLIGPGQFLAFDATLLGIGLDAEEGESLHLIEPNQRGLPGRFEDQVSFTSTEPGVSLGRSPNGENDLFPLSRQTFGVSNARPRVDRLVISELHIRPLDPDGDNGALREDAFEFVEVTNVTDARLDVSHWQLQGAVQWTFPEGTVLAPRESLVVVPFDPLPNSLRTLSFRLTFNAAPQVQLMGPWTGRLMEPSGEVRLVRPPGEPANVLSAGRVLVDRVVYATVAPWPKLEHPSMNSIQRTGPSAFGDRSSSWSAKRATPGSVNFVSTLDGDLTGEGRIDDADVDQFCGAIRQQEIGDLDLNGDGRLDLSDLDQYLADFLGASVGDASLDGVFNSRDWLQVLMAGQYEDAVGGNSSWATGDWNCDGEFNSADLVRAIQAGGYREGAAAVTGSTISHSDSNHVALLAAALDSVNTKRRRPE